MEELVKMVSEQTGLPKDKAQEAAEAVLAFLSDKLPGPIASQVKAALNNESLIDQATKGLSNLLGQ